MDGCTAGIGKCFGTTTWAPLVGGFHNGVALFGLHRVYISSCPRTPQPSAGLLCDEAAGQMRGQQSTVCGLTFRVNRPADVCSYPDRCCRVRGAQ